MNTASLWRTTAIAIVVVLMLILVIPVKEASAAPAASGCRKVYYTIRCGDTLSSIARRFGVNMWELARINGIRNPNVIYAGRTLVIRTDCCTNCCTTCGGGRVYIVRWGDTLSAIAWRYGTSVWAIAQANGIRNINCIYAGQRLVIP